MKQLPVPEYTVSVMTAVTRKRQCGVVLDARPKTVANVCDTYIGTFPVVIKPKAVMSAGRAIINRCVKGEWKHGGSFFPADASDSATLWIQNQKLWGEQENAVNSSQTETAAQAAAGKIVVA